MSDNLNSVVSTVVIDGNKVLFSHLKLRQSFNQHHSFTLLLNHEVYERRWLDTPGQVFPLVGSNVKISLKQKVTGEEHIFIGIIREVSYLGKNGVHNDIRISGGSPTLLLDGNRTMDSFMNKTLNSIVTEAVSNSGNDAELTINPAFKSTISYLCQYKESCFDFLNRLSWIYGEWFYYDGLKILFGKPASLETVELTYDIHLIELELSTRIAPVRFGLYDYLQHESKEESHLSTDEDVSLSGYGKIALTRSSSVFSSNGMVPSEAPVGTKSELKALVEIEKSRSLGEMFTLKGRSKTCQVSIGKVIKAKLPRGMDVSVKDIDKFLVTEVVHTVDDAGRYENSFSAIVADVNSIPMAEVASPLTGPQLATVLDNGDDKGRIKVQLQWQKQSGKSTNWVRVQTPDGGTSDKGARGSVFIPEVGDQVMVGFSYGDPSRPYVMGSLFPENIGKGGGSGNKSKSITTRSGSSLKLDDETGSVILTDQTGNNLIVIDGKDTITITSTKAINITNGKSFISIEDETIAISAKQIGINGENEIIAQSTNEILTVKKGDGILGTGANVNFTAKKVLELGAKNLNATGSEVNIKGEATAVLEGGIVKINS